MSADSAPALQLFIFKNRAYVGSELFDTSMELQLGRDPRAALPLEDLSVEPRHCALRMRGGALEARPLAGETLLNGAPLTAPALLTPRDELSLGPYTFRTRLHWREEPGAAEATEPAGSTSEPAEAVAVRVASALSSSVGSGPEPAPARAIAGECAVHGTDSKPSLEPGSAATGRTGQPPPAATFSDSAEVDRAPALGATEAEELELFAAEIEHHLREELAPRTGSGALGAAIPAPPEEEAPGGLLESAAYAEEPELPIPSALPEAELTPPPPTWEAAGSAYRVSAKAERLAAAMSAQLGRLLPEDEAARAPEPPEAPAARPSRRPPPPPPAPPSKRPGRRVVAARLLELTPAPISGLPGRRGVEICAWRGDERQAVHQLTTPGEAYVLGQSAPSGDPLPANGHPGLRLARLTEDYEVELRLDPGLSGTLRSGGQERALRDAAELSLQGGDSARISVPGGDPSCYELYVFGA